MSMAIIECLISMSKFTLLMHLLSTCAYISTGSECVLIYR